MPRGTGDLQKLAFELGAGERSLRRAVETGALRCRRPGPRRLEVDARERAYLRRHWPLIAELRRALRTEPRVRLAVLFGSVARGDDRPDSDVDLLVDMPGADRRDLWRLGERLGQALGRRVQGVSVDRAREAPILLADVLAQGRVIIDRDRRWSVLKRQQQTIVRRAQVAERELLRDARGALEYFEQLAGP